MDTIPENHLKSQGPPRPGGSSWDDTDGSAIGVDVGVSLGNQEAEGEGEDMVVAVRFCGTMAISAIQVL
eukprot:1153437-Pelagomonas_calceolata.AAC.2